MGYETWEFDKKEKVEFAQFPVGITRIRIVDKAPYVRWTHWMPNVTKNGKGRSVTCIGKECPICDIRRRQKANKEKQTHNMAQRITMHIINRETGRLEIMEQGKTFFEDVRDLMRDLKEDGKQLIDVDLRVRRRGTGKDDTSYRLDIDEEYPLSSTDEDLLKGKVDFNEYFAPPTKAQILDLLEGKKWEDVIVQSENTEEETKEEPKTEAESDEEFEIK